MTRINIAASAAGIALAFAACLGAVQATAAINRHLSYTGCMAENNSPAHCSFIANNDHH